MESLRCARCGEVIGFYEPIRVLLPDGTLRKGSRLMLRDELATEDRVLHEGCYRGSELEGTGSR